ncbi:hypothetical protein HDU86_000138 [Geranomyces michiganensis]|nr:hypothetical protein HDU86_000138 [Geranomyces michiganensis]
MDGSRGDSGGRSERSGGGGGSGGKRESPDVPGLEVLLQNVIAERNALRQQNDQLWKIIEKQRAIIAQLQASSSPAQQSHQEQQQQQHSSQQQQGSAGGDGLVAGGMAAGGGQTVLSPMLGRPEANYFATNGPQQRPTSTGHKHPHSAHRERVASDRPAHPTTMHDESLPNRRSMDEPGDGHSPRARSASDPHHSALTLPMITINGGRNSQQQQQLLLQQQQLQQQQLQQQHQHQLQQQHQHQNQRGPGSAHERRERSASGSAPKPPAVLPHVSGKQSSSSSNSNVRSSGQNVGNIYTHEESPSGSGFIQISGLNVDERAPGSRSSSAHGSAAAGARSRKSQPPPPPPPPPGGLSDAGESSSDNNMNVAGQATSASHARRSAESRRRTMRPVSERGARLAHLNEGDHAHSEGTHLDAPHHPEPGLEQGGETGAAAASDAAAGNSQTLEQGDSLERIKPKAPPPSKTLRHVRQSREFKGEPQPEPPFVTPPIATDAAAANGPADEEQSRESSTVVQDHGRLAAGDAAGDDSSKHPKFLGVTPAAQLGSALSITMTSNTTPTSSSGAGDGGSSIKDSPFRNLFKSTDQVKVAVTGSQIRVNDKGREVIGFTISIKDLGGAELWRVEKVYSDFLSLDMKLKANQPKTVTGRIGKLPEKALFTTHSPSKSDQRKVQLELYLQNVKEVCRDSPDLLQFLSSDVLSNEKLAMPSSTASSASQSVKEGYLFKKGKNFGAWKTRYFVLKPGGVLEYYESQKDRTNLLGCIKLKYVFVSRQSSSSPFDGAQSGQTTGSPNAGGGSAQQPGVDTDYRHAFMLTEYKKSCFAPENKDKGGEQFTDAKVISRHILCAENDEDRDEWVRSVAKEIKTVRPDPPGGTRRPDEPPGTFGADMRVVEPPPQQASVVLDDNGREEGLYGGGQDGMRPSSDREPATETDEEPPALSPRAVSIPMLKQGSPPHPSNMATPPSPSTPKSRGTRIHVDDMERVMMQPEPAPLVSLIDGGSLVNNAAGNAAPAANKATDKKNRRITTFNWGKKSKDSLANTNSRSQSQIDPSRRLFGVSLDQAVAVSRIRDDLPLPSVIYRCIEYLDAKKANEEEGIYRLSGSSSVIQGLKAAFDNEGDFDILSSQQYFDVHAVAGLLKLYLRELPTPVLTKELQRSFLYVMDLTAREERISELARLVMLLPIANYTLLKTLMAHLVRVVRRCDVNKMNVRNVGIVFSPTVGVPAGVFTLMMAEYATIFWWDGKEESRANSRINDAGQEDSVPAMENASGDAPATDTDGISSADEPSAELPTPKRRQPNSAKRRQRQYAMSAGLALVNGAPEDNPAAAPSGGSRPQTAGNAASASNGDHHLHTHHQQHNQSHQQHYTNDPEPMPTGVDSLSRSLPRPISGSLRASRPPSALSPQQQQQQQQQHQTSKSVPTSLLSTHQPQPPPADPDHRSISSSEVHVHGEEEVDSEGGRGDDDDDDDVYDRSESDVEIFQEDDMRDFGTAG